MYIYSYMFLFQLTVFDRNNGAFMYDLDGIPPISSNFGVRCALSLGAVVTPETKYILPILDTYMVWRVIISKWG